jgi:hypothetical protein
MRKFQFDRKDSKTRRKRLNFVLNNPEEAVSQAELDRATKFAEWMTGRLEDATDQVYDIVDILEDPNSEFRLKADALKVEMGESLQQLGETITKVEATLVSKYKGRCAAVELKVSSGRGQKQEWALLFWQRKGVWGLYSLNADGQMNRLVNSNMAVRMAAVGALEDLLVGLQYEDEAA